jgi:opacity protein-like surface antigen
LGITTGLTPTVPEGIPSRVTTALLQTNYAIAHDWWVGARAGYTNGYFFGFSPELNGWLAGASLNYEIWRNLLLTLDYQFTTEHSDGPLTSFTENTYTAGLTYRY